MEICSHSVGEKASRTRRRRGISELEDQDCPDGVVRSSSIRLCRRPGSNPNEGGPFVASLRVKISAGRRQFESSSESSWKAGKAQGRMS